MFGRSALRDAIDRLNDANVAVYTVDARGVLLDPDSAIDPSDLIADIKAEHEESRGDILSVIATSTGGVPYRNTNRLDTVISQALADRSLVYVLDYYPRHGNWNGKFHKLQVKTSRSGVRLRYRASYRATLPAKPRPQEQQQMLAAIASSPLDYAGLHYNVEVEPGLASRSAFPLDVPADEVQWSSREGKMLAMLEIWFIQKRATGDDVTTNSSKASIQLTTDEYQTALSAGVSLATDLKLDASTDKVRVMVQDENSGKVGSCRCPCQREKYCSTPALVDRRAVRHRGVHSPSKTQAGKRRCTLHRHLRASNSAPILRRERWRLARSEPRARHSYARLSASPSERW